LSSEIRLGRLALGLTATLQKFSQPPPLYAILVLEWLAFEPLMASWSELNPGLDAVLT
jgi:hypothetical protein